jgi:hypothetical protein
MIILLSAALAAAAPAASATPPVDTHAQHKSEGMAGHEQMKDCCKCCEEMMAKMHEGHSSKHEEHKSN